MRTWCFYFFTWAVVTLRGRDSSHSLAFVANIDCCSCGNYEAIHISCWKTLWGPRDPYSSLCMAQARCVCVCVYPYKCCTWRFYSGLVRHCCSGTTHFTAGKNREILEMRYVFSLWIGGWRLQSLINALQINRIWKKIRYVTHMTSVSRYWVAVICILGTHGDVMLTKNLTWLL